MKKVKSTLAFLALAGIISLVSCKNPKPNAETSTTEKIDELHNTVDDLKDEADSVGEKVHDGAGAAEDEINEGIEGVKDKFQHEAETAKRNLQRLDDAKGKLKEKAGEISTKVHNARKALGPDK